MTALIDVLLYLFIIGAAVLIVGIITYGIYRMDIKIKRANARLIWRTVARHRRANR